MQTYFITVTIISYHFISSFI